MLVRFDPFREIDRFLEAAASATSGTAARSVPMNAVRRGDRLVVTFDLPGVAPDSIDLTVERNQLTVTAERVVERKEGEEWLVAERPVGRFTRQLLLGDNLDTDHIEAQFLDGVLEVRIPVAEQAKPRKVAISHAGGQSEAIEANSTAA
jgi:HSP20 family protein